MKSTIQVLIILIICFCTRNSFGQNLYAGIEIGGKGIKVTIIKIKNLEIGEFELLKSWVRNTNITKNLDSENNFTKADIDETSYVVVDLLDELEKTFKIEPTNVFVIASSSVAVAKNRQELVDKITLLTKRKIDFISPEIESKLIIKGAIPQKEYANSVMLDLGSGSVKGGIIDVLEDESYTVLPFGIKFGTTTLTEIISSKIKNNYDENAFSKKLESFKDTLNESIKTMYATVPRAKTIKNVYMLGGATWAFMTLSKPNEIDAYQFFNYQDVLKYKDQVTNYYNEFIKKEYINRDYERVLKSFDKESLIAGANLLAQLTENLTNPEEKQYYFVRQGQVAWLIAFIVDSVRLKNMVQKQ